MPTPKGGYRTADGQRCPSVTTICNRFKESGGLIHWANTIAREPLLEARHLLAQVLAGQTQTESIARFIARATEDTFDYRLVRDKAADAGAVAHEMFDCFVRKIEFDPAPYAAPIVRMAKPAFEAGAEWAAQSRYEVVETEVALVSETHRFGGTRDGILVSGKRAIADVKTSRAIYPEMLLQIAAYGILDEEHGHTIDGGYHLLKFSKQEHLGDPVRFAHFYWDQLDTARRAFIRARSLYDDMAELGKLVK